MNRSQVFLMNFEAISAFLDTWYAKLEIGEKGHGRVYIPIRPICEMIGVDGNGQRRRINRDPVLSVEVV